MSETVTKDELKRWAKRTGIDLRTLENRISRGWPLWQAVTEKPRRYDEGIEFRGRPMSLRLWAREIGIGYMALYYRLHVYKWPIEKALTTPHTGRGPKRKVKA